MKQIQYNLMSFSVYSLKKRENLKNSQSHANRHDTPIDCISFMLVLRRVIVTFQNLSLSFLVSFLTCHQRLFRGTARVDIFHPLRIFSLSVFME